MSKQARVAEARGNLEAAWSLADRAIAAAEASINARGQGADVLPDLVLLRSDIGRQLQRPDQAVADADRAVQLLQGASQPGTYSMTVGTAHLTLGRALQAQSRREEAESAFRTAVEHLHNAAGAGHAAGWTRREPRRRS